MSDLPEVRCRGPLCHRPLTALESRARGYGRQCWDEYVAAHPEFASPKRQPSVPSARRPRAAVDPVPGQEELFETLEVFND